MCGHPRERQLQQHPGGGYIWGLKSVTVDRGQDGYEVEDGQREPIESENESWLGSRFAKRVLGGDDGGW